MKILVRLSPELTTKSSRVRARFQSKLIANISSAFREQGIWFELKNEWTRLLIDIKQEDLPEASHLLTRIFCIDSFSAVEHECGTDFAEIIRTGAESYKDVVKGKTFAVRAKRSKSFSYTSLDINRELGSALYGYAKGVDLENPEVTISLEVRSERVYFFCCQKKGPGGYPYGVAGSAVCLISGGFDSAVAAWLVQKRGALLDFVFCNLAGQEYENSVLAVVRLFVDNWCHGENPRIHLVDFTDIVLAIKEKIGGGYVPVILKRFFYRTAEKIALETDSQAIVTGEALGQVSSQTLHNLRAIEDVTQLPVLRPVIGLDKVEICALARKIGTYELSARIKEYCELVPDRPITSCKVSTARKEESKFDLDLIDQAVRSRRILNIKEISISDLIDNSVCLTEIPENALVLDIRSEEEYGAFHLPGARHLKYAEILLKDNKPLPKDRLLVIYCQFGLKSAVAAEKLKKDGFSAFSLKGGLKSFMNKR